MACPLCGNEEDKYKFGSRSTSIEPGKSRVTHNVDLSGLVKGAEGQKRAFMLYKGLTMAGNYGRESTITPYARFRSTSVTDSLGFSSPSIAGYASTGAKSNSSYSSSSYSGKG